MGDNVKRIDFGEPEEVVSSNKVNSTVEEGSCVTRKIPQQISFDTPSGEKSESVQLGTRDFNKDEPKQVDSGSREQKSASVTEDAPKQRTVSTGVEPVQARMLEKMLKRIEMDGESSNPIWGTAPQTSDIVLNADSSLDKVGTLTKEYDAINSIENALNKEYESLLNVARMQEGLENFADAELGKSDRKEIFIHFMVGEQVVGEYEGFEGDKLTLPTAEQIKSVLGPAWDATQFAGWNSDGIATQNDVHAILKRQHSVNLLLSGKSIATVMVTDETKTLTVVENNIERLGLITPIMSNYSVYCNTKIITSDNVINVEPKTEAARQSIQSKLKDANKCTVVFAMRPSDIGIDSSKISRDELIKAMTIMRVQVPYGEAVEPPSDEILAQHGLKTPFSSYYSWSGDLSCIKGNTVFKAEPLSIVDKVDNMSTEDFMEAGMGMVHRAFNAIKYPALLYTSHKLLKEFEKGRKLQTKDFIFLRRGNELMFFRYTGVRSAVEIPAMVNGMYVKHIHPCALSSGPFRVSTLLNRHKLFSTDRFSNSAGSTSQLILPNTVKYIPANFLYRVTGVTEIVIPESVTEMSPNAFNGSCVEEIYFNGICPRGFDPKSVDADVFVRRKAYKSFF